jgi:centrosomal protein CEP290
VQVSDLEEERRKLRLEVKFRAKYHGKTALEMGLSPEQLLLLEEYVEGLEGGRNPEERLVTQLQQRVSWASMFGGGCWQGGGDLRSCWLQPAPTGCWLCIVAAMVCKPGGK